jgi:quercetin dioxygenase-like cupin family protein
MKITKIDSTQEATPGPAMDGYFDGEVKVYHLVTSAESNDLDLLCVHFSAGARTRPHVHHQDQVLHIIEGQGIVADETEKHVVSAGEVITIPTGTWHWHGATLHSEMTHISIMKRGSSDWTVEEKDWATGYEE